MAKVNRCLAKHYWGPWGHKWFYCVLLILSKLCSVNSDILVGTDHICLVPSGIYTCARELATDMTATWKYASANCLLPRDSSLLTTKLPVGYDNSLGNGLTPHGSGSQDSLQFGQQLKPTWQTSPHLSWHICWLWEMHLCKWSDCLVKCCSFKCWFDRAIMAANFGNILWLALLTGSHVTNGTNWSCLKTTHTYLLQL